MKTRITCTNKRLESAHETSQTQAIPQSFIAEQQQRRLDTLQAEMDQSTQPRQRIIAKNLISGSQSPDPTQDIGFSTAGIVYTRSQRDEMTTRLKRKQQKNQQLQVSQSQARESDFSSSLPQKPSPQNPHHDIFSDEDEEWEEFLNRDMKGELQ